MPIARGVMTHSSEQTLMFSTGTGVALSGMSDHLGCPQTEAECLSLRQAAMLNHGYGVTMCRIYYHPTLCVSFRDADGIVS